VRLPLRPSILTDADLRTAIAESTHGRDRALADDRRAVARIFSAVLLALETDERRRVTGTGLDVYGVNIADEDDDPEAVDAARHMGAYLCAGLAKDHGANTPLGELWQHVAVYLANARSERDADLFTLRAGLDGAAMEN
jgi:hypothetical protein